jgi:hypothetical protein
MNQHAPDTPATPNAIEVTCPCGAVHSFARTFAGRIARCPQLQRRFQIPPKSAAAVFLEADSVVVPTAKTVPPLAQTETASRATDKHVLANIGLVDVEHLVLLRYFLGQ